LGEAGREASWVTGVGASRAVGYLTVMAVLMAGTFAKLKYAWWGMGGMATYGSVMERLTSTRRAHSLMRRECWILTLA